MNPRAWFLRQLAKLLRDAGYEVRKLPTKPDEQKAATTAALRRYVERQGAA